MDIDIFTEFQRKGLETNGGFRQLFLDTLDQAKAADEAGFQCWWQVEHHCTPDFSLSSCPEIILTAIALATKQMQIGHSGVLAPLSINHWLRSAERTATLDQISGGRLQVGLAKSNGKEFETFQTTLAQAQADLFELTKLLPKAWTETTFSWNSDRWKVGARDVQPKPLQKPHPPLWHMAGSAGSFREAGKMGVGVIGTTVFTPLEILASYLKSYREGVAECREPAGHIMNDRAGVFTFVHVAESERAAVESGAARAAIWYVSTIPGVLNVPRDAFYQSIRGNTDPRSKIDWSASEQPVYTTELTDRNPAVALMKREFAGEHLSNEEIYDVIKDIDSVIIGDVKTCKRKMEAFKDVGFDKLLCMMQIGDVPHNNVLASIGAIGKHLIPYFSARRRGL